MSRERRVARLEERMRALLLTTLFTVGCGATVIDTSFQLDPAIVSLSPTRGPTRGGTPLLIRGSGLCLEPEVLVDGGPARSVERLSDSLLAVETPGHPMGPATFEVRCNGLTVGAALEFTYHATDVELQTTLALPTDLSPSTLTFFADFDGDGRDDVALVDPFASLSLSVLINRGPYAFGSDDDLLFGFEGEPRSPYFAIADLDGDDTPDVVTFGGSGERWKIKGWRIDGTEIGLYNVKRTRLEAAHIVDLDADGRFDLITLEDGRVRVQIGLGSFSFEPPVDLAYYACPGLAGVGGLPPPFRPDAADMNGDGVEDWTFPLCESREAGPHWITVLSDRQRAFTTVTSSTPDGGLVYFDQDPLPDRYRIDAPAPGDRESRVSIWRGVSPGEYSATPELFAVPCPVDRPDCANERLEMFLPNHFDLDRDGDPELVRCTPSTYTRVDSLSLVELGAHSTSHIIAENDLDIVLLGVAEIDGDGTPEIVLGGTQPHTLFLRDLDSQDLLQGFATSELPVVSDANGYTAVVGDFDGDGNKDILAVCDGGLCQQEGRGDGTFSSLHRVIEQRVPDNAPFSAIRLGRFDRDQRDDYYYFNAIHRSAGQEKVQLEGCNVADATVVDVDRDGIDEIVARCEQPTASVLFDHLDGAPRSRALELPNQNVLAEHWHFAELDGDGVLDAIGSTPVSLEVRIMHGVADDRVIRFEERAVIWDTRLFGAELYEIATHDLDGDGDDDLLIYDPVGFTAHFFRNDAGTFVFTHRAFDTNVDFNIHMTCDLGGFGRQSVVTAGIGQSLGIALTREGEDYASVLLPALPRSLFTPLTVTPIACADFTSDGRPDVLVATGRHANSVLINRSR